MSGFLETLHLYTPGGPFEAVVLGVAFLVSAFCFVRTAGWHVASVVMSGSVIASLQVGDPAIPIAIAAVSVSLYVRGGIEPRPARHFAREAGLAFGGLFLYEVGRYVVGSPAPEALSNGDRIVAFERSTGTFVEPHLQEFITESESATRVFNLLYSHGFLAIVIAMILWLYFVDPARYRLYRNSLAISMVLAVALIALIPVAPPRLMPELGLADTVETLGAEHSFVNEFAAVPSLHVGWLALTGFVLAMPVKGRRKWLIGASPGAAMGVTVVATGNHYWVDGVIGSLIAVGPALQLRYGLWGRFEHSVSNGWGGLAPEAQHRVQATSLSLGGLFLYLAAAQVIDPGFTNFWGYLFFQVGATLALLVAGEILFARSGGLSSVTHGIAVVCSFADVLGTDGNLYSSIDEYDKVTHFMGTAALTAGAYDLLRAMAARHSRFTPAGDRLALAVTFGVLAGFGWEVYEYLGDAVFHTTRLQGRWDTLNDLVSDAAGAFLIGLALFVQERGSERTGRPSEEVVPTGRRR